MSKKKNRTKKKAAPPANRDPDLVPLKEAMAKEPKKAPAPAGEKKLSLLDAAAQILKSCGEPMTCRQMIGAIFEKKLWHTDAATPAATLSSAIQREMKSDASRFKKVDRGQFALAGKGA